MSRALGLDFGTTNTVLATADGDGSTRSLAFTSGAGTTDTMRTALGFTRELGADNLAQLRVEAGQAAIRLFIDSPGGCRFLQSIKTFAASAAFQATTVHARRHSFEDLMAAFLRRLIDYAGEAWPADIERLVVGRPVRFAGANADDALAVERYGAALARFGFPRSPTSTSRSPPPTGSRAAWPATPPSWSPISAAAPPTIRSSVSSGRRGGFPPRRSAMAASASPGTSSTTA